MSISKNLQDIIAKQKAVLVELQEEANVLASHNLTVENDNLKKEVTCLQKELLDHDEKNKELKERNNDLKNALFGQIYSEKLQIINNSHSKIDIYFKSEIDGELNTLIATENNLIDYTKNLQKHLEKNRVEHSEEIYKKLEQLSAEATDLIAQEKAKIENEVGAFGKNSRQQYEYLQQQHISEQNIKDLGKKNNFEAFIGGNLINKLGVLFVILGIIALSQFTLLRLPDTFKGIIMFIISGGFLVAGELLNRKKPNVFSLGITSTGVAGLYASLSISFFFLQILTMYFAIALCILITAGAFILAKRYNSQTIASFALVGGYLPIISISDGLVLVYGAMGYFAVLNILALMFSFYKKWIVTMFIGYFLNLFSIVYIISQLLIQGVDTTVFGFAQVITILYVLFAFVIYDAIPIVSNYRKKQPFAVSDIVIISFNTVISTIIMYAVFYIFKLDEFNGLMAIIFAIIHIYLAKVVDAKLTKQKQVVALFYLTGLTFVVLTIPFQFGKEWLSLGWLVQGVCFTVYGILKSEKVFKRTGYIINSLSLTSFITLDLLLEIDNLFAYKYAAITLGSLIILGAFAYKKALGSRGTKTYKYLTVINLWFYSLYLVYKLEEIIFEIYKYGFLNTYNIEFLLAMLGAAITLLYAVVLPKVSSILDKGIKIISVVLSIFAMLQVFVIIALGSVIEPSIASTDIIIANVIATFVLIIMSTLSVFAMRRVLMFFVLETKMSVEWLPFLVSAYFLILLTENLVAQFNISFTSVIISIIFIIAALIWIIYGFVKRHVFMRRFGLGLSILAIAKLFIIDLYGINQGYKIIAYFAFGVMLLGISFVYQYFNKLLLKGSENVAKELISKESTSDETTDI